MNEGCTSGEVCVYSSDWDLHFCEECGICFCDAEQCDTCLLCTDDCKTKSMEEGCSTGDFCIESSEWDTHFCKECDVCFCDTDYCDYCGLCVECCGQNSACSEGVFCIQDSEYSEHFCEKCGVCFCENELCKDCYEKGILMCANCCTDSSHTKAIRICDRAPEIVREPHDVRTVVSDCESGLDNHSHVTFSVKMKISDADTCYQWQLYDSDKNTWINLESDNGWYSGFHTPDLCVTVQTDSCVETYKYRCIVKNNFGSVTSKEAKIIADHFYEWSPYSNGDVSKYHILTCRAEVSDPHFKGNPEKHQFGEWIITDNPSVNATGRKYRVCSICDYHENVQIPKLHNHEWHTGWYTEDSKYHWHVCDICGINGEQKDKALHTYDDNVIVTNEPTEKSAGKGYKECTVCKHREEVTIPKLMHVHDYLKNPAAEYNYDSMEKIPYGYYTKYQSYNSVYHWKLCSECIEYKDGKYSGYEYDKQVHRFDQWKIKDNKTMYRSCDICGYTQEMKTPKHEEDEILISVKNGKVSVNNGSYVPYAFAKVRDKISIKAEDTYNGGLFEAWDNPVVNLVSNGEDVGVGNIYDIDDKGGIFIVKTDYLKSNEISFYLPDPEQASYFSAVRNCGYKYEYDNHLYIKAFYSICKHENVATLESTGREATCTQPGWTAATICTDCNTYLNHGEIIPAKGHQYVEKPNSAITATCSSFGYETSYVCKACGEVKCGNQIEKLPHTYGAEKIVDAPTCHSSGHKGKVCSICGDVLHTGTLPRLSHEISDYKSDYWGHWKECTNEGCKTVIGKKNVHLDRNDDKKCDVCGYNLNKYTIRYTDGVEDEVIFADKEISLTYGAATPSFGDDPYREGFVFKGWSPMVSPTVTMDVCYVAVWEKKSDNHDADDKKSQDTKLDNDRKEDTDKDNTDKDNTDKDNEEPTIEPVKPINDTDTHFVINKEYVIKSKVNIADLMTECMTALGGDPSKITGYELSNKSLAKINSKGIVSLKKKGSLTINAINKVGKGKKAQKNILCSLTIDIVDMEIVKKVDINYLTDETKLLSLIPKRPLNQKIEFSQTEKSKKIGTISENGIFYPVKDGKVKIKCTIGDDTEKVAYTIGINIKTPSINVKDGLKIKESKTRKIKLKNLPKSAKNNVKWSVADASKVEIISSGDKFIKIKALESGETEIIADIEGRKMRRRISVIKKH